MLVLLSVSVGCLVFSGVCVTVLWEKYRDRRITGVHVYDDHLLVNKRKIIVFPERYSHWTNNKAQLNNTIRSGTPGNSSLV